MSETYSCFLHGDHAEEKCPKCTLTSKTQFDLDDCLNAMRMYAMQAAAGTHGNWATWTCTAEVAGKLADAIERLQRERDEAKAALAAASSALTSVGGQADRLREALEQINQDEFSAAYSDPDALTWEDDYWRVVNIARQALGRAHETTDPSYVQAVPDHCDRITWRGHYYHLESMKRQEGKERPIDAALELIRRYGGIDGGHHKQWVLDQVVRALTGDGYAQWVIEQKAGEDGPDTYDWSEGIPP